MQRFFLGVMLALAVTGQVWAHGGSIPKSGIERGWKRQHLGDYTSEPGESLDAFVMRTAPLFDKYTAEKEWEACATIATDGQGRYGFVLTSSQASLGCILYPDDIPEGMVATNMNIHSHPATKEIYPSHMDHQIMHLRGMKVLRDEIPNQGKRGFSPEDYEAGPGYLVVAGKVLYQEGRGTIREVGKLEHRAPTRAFPRR